jgi:hypothetical protein
MALRSSDLVRALVRDCARKSPWWSPQLHQEARTGRSGFPAPTNSRLFSAIAWKLMFCRDCFAGTTGLGGERRNESPTPSFGFPTARLD